MKITATFVSIPQTGSTPPMDGSSPPPRASLLVQPETQLLCSGDPGAMIAALEVMTAKEEMKSAHDARKAAGAIEDKANEKKLDDMKTQADWKEAAGISEGAGSMVEGGLDVAGAKWGTQSTKAGWEGAGKGAGGLGKLSAALFNAEADSAGRSKESDEMQVEHAKRAWQGFNDDVKDFRELLSAAIKFYGEWASAKVQSEQAAIHRT